MLKVDRCCCCFSLKKGSLIIGYVSAVLSIAYLIWLCEVPGYLTAPRPDQAKINGTGNLTSQTMSPKGKVENVPKVVVATKVENVPKVVVTTTQLPKEEEQTTKAEIWTFTFKCFLGFLDLGLSLVFVYGIHKNKSKYVRAFFIFLCFGLASTFVASVIAFVLKGPEVIILMIIGCAIEYYLMVVIWSLYMNMKSEEVLSANLART